MNTRIDTDILIVGAGPVGLFLATECARRELNYRIIEARANQSTHSKALAIFPRTLEIFDMAGVVQPFLQAANKVTSVGIYAHDKQLALLPFAPGDSPYPFIAMVPQNVSEQLLHGQLEKRGGRVEYETEFVAAEQADGCVRVTLNSKTGQQIVRAAFVVGCDGAHSQVRKSMGVPLEGGEYPDSFMLGDIETNDALPSDQLQLCPSEFGPAAIFPMSASRRRLVATVDHTEGDRPSIEVVRKILAQRVPKGIEARSLYWSSYFRIHHRHASKLCSGRILIAGDAAHIHSPFGGQGMNTGLHDVWNLAWKLDLYLRGVGSEDLLDSYTAERIPVITGVIRTTDLLTRVMGTPVRFVQAVRNAVIPMVSRLAPFQHAFVQRLSELGIAYHGSPIIEGPGERYLDDSMRNGAIGRKFLLMTESENVPRVSEDTRPFKHVVDIRPSQQPGIKLIRPDGYVSYSSRDSGDRAIVSVKALIAKQVLYEPSQYRATGTVPVNNRSAEHCS
jgi:2-polyprenyl-6-methoxyphenol hydroxylase-like FAD-dependent oxidoreductase